MVQQVRFRNSVYIILLLLFSNCSSKEKNKEDKMRYVNTHDVSIKTALGITYVNDFAYSGTLFTLYANGSDTIEVKEFLNGKENGTWKQFYKNNQLKEIRYFENGKKTGWYFSWWENGNKKSNAQFLNDEYEGTLKDWSSEGKLIKEMNYHAGHESGSQKAWYENGKIKSNYTIINGRRYGLLGTKNCMMYPIVFLRNNFCLILLLYLLSSCKADKKVNLPYYNTPDFTPVFVDHEKDIKEKITHTISDFSFADQHGKMITQQNIEGKIHVANFFFTSCGSICSIIMNNMSQVNNAYLTDKNIVFLSYTVTPWIDSVPRLKEYADLHQYKNPNWYMLTGNKSAIYQLARKSYFAEEDIGFSKDSTNFLHTEHFILVDKNKKIRGIYNGTLSLEIQQLIEDIKVLKEE